MPPNPATRRVPTGYIFRGRPGPKNIYFGLDFGYICIYFRGGIYMASLLLKFTDEQRARWEQAAGNNLSAWIRRVCDAAVNGVPGSVQANRAGRHAEVSEGTPGSSQTVPAPELSEEFGIPEDGEIADEVRESKDVQRDRDVPVSPGRAYAPVAPARSAKKPAAKRGKRDPKATGKAGTCPHGFAVVDGITLCQRCR